MRDRHVRARINLDGAAAGGPDRAQAEDMYRSWRSPTTRTASSFRPRTASTPRTPSTCVAAAASPLATAAPTGSTADQPVRRQEEAHHPHQGHPLSAGGPMNRLPSRAAVLACLLGYPGPRRCARPSPEIAAGDRRGARSSPASVPGPAGPDPANCAAADAFERRGPVRRTPSTGAAPPRCTCSSTCTATRATAARRWWTCCDLRAAPASTSALGELPDYLPVMLETSRRHAGGRWRADLLGELRAHPARHRHSAGRARQPARAVLRGAAGAGRRAGLTSTVRPVPPEEEPGRRRGPSPEPLVVAPPQGRPRRRQPRPRSPRSRRSPSCNGRHGGAMSSALRLLPLRHLPLHLPGRVLPRQPAALRPRPVHLEERFFAAAARWPAALGQ
ncbi:MAG: hypothetical protein KatS3mg122_1394 [Caldimonas sp.]|nr:MAG: hypothetical protein KatS3mg122_1394 [Caldimonas sp.]